MDSETSTSRPARRLRAAELTHTALLAVLMAVCAWISVPTLVPFTLQSFAVFLALGLLGGRRGTLAIGLYLLMGAVGLPVFSGGTGGVGVLFGATGGYLLGFLASGLVFRLVSGLLGQRTWATALALGLGLAVCYAFGTAWFMLVYARTSGPVGLGAALGWCVAPFVLPDLAKLGLALLLAKRLKPHIKA